jgi:D-alanine-D-alanine ligase
MNKAHTVLLVGDIVDDLNRSEDFTIFDEDNPTEEEVDKLESYLVKAGYHVEVQNSVNDFVKAPPKDKGTIVFPLWRGGESRNRTVVIPAVCETLNLRYVGSDAFVQATCQDKSLSKALAAMIGMESPKEIVLYTPSELRNFRPSSTLSFPLVLKPLFSACSIGINTNSFCVSDSEAKAKAKELFDQNLGPVLCEEFIQGDEISVCYYEHKGEIVEKCVAIYHDQNGICPFENSLFTFEDKLNVKPPWSVSLWNGILDEGVWSAIQVLTRKLGKVDYMRVDGRIRNGKFVLIELTPDIHLSLKSAFLGGFAKAGLPPEVLLDNIIKTSIGNLPNEHFVLDFKKD